MTNQHHLPPPTNRYSAFTSGGWMPAYVILLVFLLSYLSDMCYFLPIDCEESLFIQCWVSSLLLHPFLTDIVHRRFWYSFGIRSADQFLTSFITPSLWSLRIFLSVIVNSRHPPDNISPGYYIFTCLYISFSTPPSPSLFFVFVIYLLIIRRILSVCVLYIIADFRGACVFLLFLL